MAQKRKTTKRFTPQDQQALALWAAVCAEHVLPRFEEQHPNDDRPRQAIEAARAWARGEIKVGAARTAALATHAAARAAGHAAGTAHVAGHTPHAAAYAVKAAPDSAAERDWQMRRLPKHLRLVVFSTS